MKKYIIITPAYPIFLLAIFTFLMTACKKEDITPYIDQNTLPLKFTVNEYDLFFEIDAGQSLFTSAQSTIITASEPSETIVFELQADLLIDSFSIQDINGIENPLVQWEKLGEVKYGRGLEDELFSRFKLQPIDPISAGQKLRLFIKYHIDPSAVRSQLENELLKFTISTKGSRALHPVNGTFPYFGALVAAPFRISLKHKQDQHSCVPGNLTSSEAGADYVTEVFETGIARIPVFYVGPGELIDRSQNGITMSYLLAPGQSLPEEVIDNTFKVARLYTENFGNPGTQSYRIAYVEVQGSSTTGESKGNAIYFAYRRNDDHNWDEQAKLNFMQLISHELFHNWNLWYLNWEGDLYEWFIEGGAGFISAWTGEEVLGEQAGRDIRSTFVTGYSERKGYNASTTLQHAQKSGEAEVSLIYSYGALVWEQLRQKIGDEAFFTGLSDFFANNESQAVNADALFTAIQAHTSVPVESYLHQWISNNAQIDLSIGEVQIEPKGNGFETTVGFNIDSEKDYEIFSTIGYKTSALGSLITVDMHATTKGSQTISFTSDQRPVFIQLDPDFRIPQTELNNEIWLD